ncbi:MAG: DegT/DnrJ/EryC1/StrS family aminotransferase, partial [Pseudomonadota bacterium]
MIPYGRQLIEEDDIRAVVKVLRSDWLTTGPAIERFEKAFADFVGAKY